MGAGIAQVSVQAGFETVGRAGRAGLVAPRRATIEGERSRGGEEGRRAEGARAAGSTRMCQTTGVAEPADCDPVSEAGLGGRALQRELLRELDRVTPPDPI